MNTTTIQALKRNNKARLKKRILLAIQTLAAALVTLVFLFPIYWMIVTSLKTEAEVLALRQSIFVESWQFVNYANVWNKLPFGRYMLNTLIVTLGQMAITFSTGILAAYAFARGRFRGKHLAFLYVLGAMMIPIQIKFVPLYIMISQAGLKNTYLGLILADCVSPYLIFMMRQAFLGVDDSYIDAGRVDGMNKIGIITRVLVPMCKPTLVTVGLITFIGGWNSYFWPKIITSDDSVRVLTIGLTYLKQTFAGEAARNYHEIMAGAVISCAPVLIIFMIFQKQMLSGYTKAAMK